MLHISLANWVGMPTVVCVYVWVRLWQNFNALNHKNFKQKQQQKQSTASVGLADFWYFLKKRTFLKQKNKKKPNE